MTGDDTEVDAFAERIQQLSNIPAPSSLLVSQILDDLAAFRELYDVLLKCDAKTLTRVANVLQQWLDHVDSSPKPQALEMLVKVMSQLEDPAFTCNLVRVHLTDNELSRGRHGVVREGKYQGQSVAVKCPRKPRHSRLLQREALVWRQMKHPSIVPFFGMADVPGSFGIVTPIMPLGNLRMFLEARLQLDSSTYDRMIESVAAGLNYLHQCGIVHCDIKPENIVVQESDKGYSTLIIDFGLAIVGDDLGRECDPGPSTAEKWRDFRRRPVARATEVQKPDSASDVWAFGLLCCWMCCLIDPPARIGMITLPIRPSMTQCTTHPMDDLLWGIIVDCCNSARGHRPNMSHVLRALRSRHERRRRENVAIGIRGWRALKGLVGYVWPRLWGWLQHVLLPRKRLES